MKIRTATAEDAEDITRIYAPIVQETPTSFELTVPDVTEIRKRIEKTLLTHPWLVAEEDGQVFAYAYASAHRSREAYQWSTDVSVYVDSAVRRCGIGRRLYEHLLRDIKAKGFVNAYAGITLPNEGSVGLHEAMGFEPIGIYRNVGFKLGRWHDVGWWGRQIGTLEDIPHPPQ